MLKRALITIVILICLSFTIFAADFKTPHRFKPGDVISADVLNEIFDYIDSTKKTLVPLNLVGSWKCTKYTTYMGPSAMIPPGYKVSSGNLFISMDTLSLNISQSSDGSVQWRSPSRNAFAGIFKMYNASDVLVNGRYGDECVGNGIIDAIEGDFAVSSNNCLSDLSGFGPAIYTYKLDVNKISDTRMRLSIPATACLLCDLQNVSPTEPLNLVVSNNNKNINLSWTDNSNDETGFKIVRRDTLDGNWVEVGSTEANTNSFSETVTSAGTYWYRVKAYNNNGHSLGSNVVKVSID